MAILFSNCFTDYTGAAARLFWGLPINPHGKRMTMDFSCFGLSHQGTKGRTTC